MNIKCGPIGGGFPRHPNTFLMCIFFAVRYTYQHMLCNVAIADCTLVNHVVHYKNNQNIPYRVAIVDCTHVGSVTDSFKDLVTLHWRTLQQIFW